MESAAAIIGLCILVVVVAYSACKVIDRLTLDGTTADDSLASFRDRLLQPQFAELEKYFGVPVPAALRRLYHDNGMLQRENIEFQIQSDEGNQLDFVLQSFLPADKRSVEESCCGEPLQRRYPFAVDDFGNYFYISISHDQADECPVYFYDQDAGESIFLSDRLDMFISSLPAIP